MDSIFFSSPFDDEQDELEQYEEFALPVDASPAEIAALNHPRTTKEYAKENCTGREAKHRRRKEGYHKNDKRRNRRKNLVVVMPSKHALEIQRAACLQGIQDRNDLDIRVKQSLCEQISKMPALCFKKFSCAVATNVKKRIMEEKIDLCDDAIWTWARV